MSSEIVEQETELSGFRARMEELDDKRLGTAGRRCKTLKSRIFSAENRIATNVERCEEARSLIDRHRTGHCGRRGKNARAARSNRTDRSASGANDRDPARARSFARGAQPDESRAAREERSAAERRYSRSRRRGRKACDARLSSLRNEISAAAGRREASETRLRLLQGESEAASNAAGEFGARIKRDRTPRPPCRTGCAGCPGGAVRCPDSLRGRAGKRARPPKPH